MRYAHLLIVTSGALSSVACHGKYDVHNYAETLAESVCAKAYDCCTQAEVEASEQSSYGHNKDACKDSTSDTLGFKEDKIQRGIDKHRVVYHEELFKTCLDNFAALSCDALKSRVSSMAEDCDTYLTPLVEDGGVCEIDEECVSGNCQIPDENDGTGTCQAYAAVGASCDSVSCGPGSYCDGGTCVTAKADAESCTANLQCDTGGCNGYDSDTGTAGTCGLKGGPDSACYLTKGCAAGEPQAFAALLAVLLMWRSRRRE